MCLTVGFEREVCLTHPRVERGEEMSVTVCLTHQDRIERVCVCLSVCLPR